MLGAHVASRIQETVLKKFNSFFSVVVQSKHILVNFFYKKCQEELSDPSAGYIE